MDMMRMELLADECGRISEQTGKCDMRRGIDDSLKRLEGIMKAKDDIHDFMESHRGMFAKDGGGDFSISVPRSDGHWAYIILFGDRSGFSQHGVDEVGDFLYEYKRALKPEWSDKADLEELHRLVHEMDILEKVYADIVPNAIVKHLEDVRRKRMDYYERTKRICGETPVKTKTYTVTITECEA